MSERDEVRADAETDEASPAAGGPPLSHRQPRKAMPLPQ